ncbi:MAG: hypothetical protein AAF970_05890 [Bacteroidota bacterium]
MRLLRRHSLLCALLFVLGSVVLPAVHAAGHVLDDHAHHGDDPHEPSHTLDCDLCAHLVLISGTLDTTKSSAPAFRTVPQSAAPTLLMLSTATRTLQSPRAPPHGG